MRLAQAHGARRGSIVAVILVAVILGTLGGVALWMSGSYKRHGVHESLRYAAQRMCRAAAEEAALLIHNGKLDVVIDAALADQTTKDITSHLPADVHDRVMSMSGVKSGLIPKVFVRAAVASPDGLRRTPAAQWQNIIQEVRDAKNVEGVKFWQEMKDKNLISATLPDSNEFWNSYVKSIKIDNFKPEVIVKYSNAVPGQSNGSNDGSSDPTSFEEKSLPEGKELYLLFGSQGARAVTGRSTTMQVPEYRMDASRKPSIEQVKAAWSKAVVSAAKDAAAKVESCGSNPAGAMAHLVGDLKENEVVSSGTERNAAKAFLESSQLGETKSYLLEITSQCEYAGADGSRMAGRMSHTVYRLFQKAPWEAAVREMQSSLVRCLVTGCGGAHAAYSPAEIASAWPPEPVRPGDPTNSSHRVSVTDAAGNPTSTLFDPDKIITRPIDDILPTAVGSRLYPYTLVSTIARGKR